MFGATIGDKVITLKPTRHKMTPAGVLGTVVADQTDKDFGCRVLRVQFPTQSCLFLDDKTIVRKIRLVK